MTLLQIVKMAIFLSRYAVPINETVHHLPYSFFLNMINIIDFSNLVVVVVVHVVYSTSSLRLKHGCNKQVIAHTPGVATSSSNPQSLLNEILAQISSQK
jgi:hypothetical protein